MFSNPYDQFTQNSVRNNSQGLPQNSQIRFKPQDKQSQISSRVDFHNTVSGLEDSKVDILNLWSIKSKVNQCVNSNRNEVESIEEEIVDSDKKQDSILKKNNHQVQLGQTFKQDIGIINKQKDNIATIHVLFEQEFQGSTAKQIFYKKINRPSWNIHKIRKRFQNINFLQRIFKTDESKELEKLTKSISHLPLSIKSIKQFNLNNDPWKKILRSLTNLCQIGAILRQKQNFRRNPDYPQFLIRLLEINQNQLEKLCQFIQSTLIIDQGKELRIQEGVNQEYDNLIQIQNKIQTILQTLLDRYLIQLKEINEDSINLKISLVKFPIQGFQLKTTIEDQEQQDTLNYVIESLSDWKLIHQQDSDFYFSNNFTQNLNEQYEHIDTDIALLLQKIVVEITKQILQYEEFLTMVEVQIAKLQYHCTIIRLMDKYKLIVPNIVLESLIRIQGGRHLIAENQKKDFVENDINVADDRVIIVTGPNYSGKSVYIKQIGLIVYMAHCGLPVPCRQATIGLFDSFYSLIGGEIQRMGSQKLTDQELLQLSYISQNATNRSLIFFDEFGKNFKFDIGSALFSSSIEYIINNQKTSEINQIYNIQFETKPIIVAATHYHSVLQRDFTKLKLIQFIKMQVKLQESERDQKIIFRYKTQVIDQPNSQSMALEVAREVTNDDFFYQRGKQVLNSLVQRHGLSRFSNI